MAAKVGYGSVVNLHILRVCNASSDQVCKHNSVDPTAALVALLYEWER